MKNSEQNYFIDFLRFIFSLCILFYHSWIFSGTFGNGIFNHGYLAVDFYFIVTGYLMINSIYNHKNNNLPILKKSFDFTYRKIKKIFPSLLVTFLVGAMFVYGKTIIFKPKILISNKVLPELFQLGIFGYELPINSSWWYISSMIFVMALLYPFAIKYNEYYCKYIAPLIIVLTLGIVNMHKININDPINIHFFLRNGFYKALIFIPLGNISYIITDMIKRKKISKNKILFLSVFELILYITLVLNMHYLFIDTFACAILLMLNISLTFSNITFSTKVFKHTIWKHLGEFGFYIYLCNISIRTYMLRKYVNLGFTYKQLLLLFLIITFLTALVLYIIIEVIYKKLILKRKIKLIA